MSITLNHKYPLDNKFYTNPIYNKVRRAKLILFSSILAEYEDFTNYTHEGRTHLLKKIERSCYNTTVEEANKNNIIATWADENFCDLYHSICSKISFNMEKNGIVNNPNIALDILNSKIPIGQLAKMSSVELFPAKYEKN